MPITSANVDRFSKFFHRWTRQWLHNEITIKITSHLKRAATVPCETLVFKNCYLQTSEVIWLYTLQYHIIIFDGFCWSLSFPRAESTITFSASSAASSPKVQQCNTPIWTSVFLDVEQSWPQYSLLQNLGQRVYQTKAQDVNDLRRRLTDGKLEWNRALLTMALTTGAIVSMPAFKPQEDILNIHRDIY